MQQINFKLNGQEKNVLISHEMSLLKMLRETFGLTGAKEGCNKGHCGTCAVLVNGRVVMACHFPASKANGSEVVTIEGIGTPENPHPIQQAFVQTGAVQCGFCTPGMIIRAKSLLDRNLNPSREEIVKAFTPHLCRCTGYSKIFAAVASAAKILRGEAAPGSVPAQQAEQVIGMRIPRQDALAKATGTEKFAADLQKAGMLCLKILRSPLAHARIAGIDVSAARAVPGVVGVFTAKDVPGTNRLKISRADQPVLCDEKVRCIGDPVAVVAAVSEAAAVEALAGIEVRYEPLTAVHDPNQALEEGAPLIHDDHPNLLASQSISRGDTAAGFEEAAFIAENEFSTPLIEHAYLEPDAGLAYINEVGQLVIEAGSQNIHHDRMALADALGLDLKRVRVIQTPTGGAFGGKLDISVQGVLGLAALKLQQPVKLIYTREETFQYTTKRHPFKIKCRLGADRDGKLLAMEMDIISDTGAYASFGKSVMTRALIHATGPYSIPNVYLKGRVIYTNNPVSGAMRGFGVPQVNFALESQLDILAAGLGLDPLEIRRRNSLRQGSVTATGQVLPHRVGMTDCLDSVQGFYLDADSSVREFNSSHQDKKRGFGLAGMWFGPGKSKPDVSEAHAALESAGNLKVWIAAADMGQGSDTVLAQIAAQELGIPFNAVQVVSNDSCSAPDGGYSSGSRQTYMSGEAVRLAVANLKAALMERAGKLLGADPVNLECGNGRVSLRTAKERYFTLNDLVAAGVSGRYTGQKTGDISTLDPVTGEGIPYETYTFGVQMAEVEVNLASGEVRVLRVVAAHDSGTPINPMYMEGQIEGGILMGLGYGLLEAYVPGETIDFGHYRIPRAKDVPEIIPVMLSIPRPGGPFGAAGIAESALVPTASAIINAINNACGVRIFDLPANKSKVKAALNL
ncbi:MAG: molybdopterin cofactor-binding domain-containing protein [Thermincola sp.]|nr:molybdopterin cofactor-binding domain-containing protein [Thermincola sp.]MDT3702566.1 molybdopterin cofactor-binding domain-containing protein [Thermincola sp.]